MTAAIIDKRTSLHIQVLVLIARTLGGVLIQVLQGLVLLLVLAVAV